MRRQLVPALRMLLVMTVITGLAYPLLMTGMAQALFAGKANASIVERGGKPVGSSLLGQEFKGKEYFQSRPSAVAYLADGVSGAGNQGPTNPDLLRSIAERAAAYRDTNGLAADVEVPIDAVTASASGADPHISIANAKLQAQRVADARALDVATVLDLISKHTDGRSLGFLGEPGVNVLGLNLALDAANH
jgi:K+-transporting ATPase ATPase C chain